MLKEIIFPPLNRSTQTDLLRPLKMGAGIPKLIHQTFYTKDLAPELADNVAWLKELNPGWSYRLYDDEDAAFVIRQHYGARVMSYFERIDSAYGAARADLFRYLLMYRYGGVYLDMKSTLTRPLDTVLRPDDRYLLARWDNGPGPHQGWGMHWDLRALEGGELQQWHIACCAGHPFLREVIATVLRNIELYNPGLHGTGKMGVMRTTGPIAYTLALTRLLHQYPHRVGDAGRDFGFRYSIYPNEEHKQKFRAHYTRQNKPVVRTAPAKMAWAKAISVIQNVRKHTMRAR